MDVLEDQYERLLAREALEELSDGPERLLARADVGREAHRAGDPGGDELGVLVRSEDPRNAGLDVIPDLRVQDLRERPERDALAVREAAADEHQGVVGERGGELAAQARLADPRRAEDREQLGAALADRALVCLSELGELDLAPDERRVEASCEGCGALDDLAEPPGRDRAGLSLDLEVLDRLHAHGVADETVRRVADQDLAGPGGLLEARRDVDGVARRERRACRRIACEHLARVDARPDLDADAAIALELVVQTGDCVADVDDCASGAEGVVLVDDRDAEDSHDRVADELLHPSAVALERLRDRLEVPRHHPAKRLRIELFAEAGRAG
jgi:hypothetical protein